MTISLSKGQRIDLTKTNPGLKKYILALVGILISTILVKTTIWMHLHFCFMKMVELKALMILCSITILRRLMVLLFIQVIIGLVRGR